MPFIGPDTGSDSQINFTEALSRFTPISANYTAQLTDINSTLRSDSATGITITLPANFPVGAVVGMFQYGAGALSLAAASGAVLRGSTGSTSQYTFTSAIVVTNVGGNAAEWIAVSTG